MVPVQLPLSISWLEGERFLAALALVVPGEARDCPPPCPGEHALLPQYTCLGFCGRRDGMGPGKARRMKSILAPGLVFPSDRVSRFIIYCHLIFHQIRSCHVFQWLGSQSSQSPRPVSSRGAAPSTLPQGSSLLSLSRASTEEESHEMPSGKHTQGGQAVALREPWVAPGHTSSPLGF